VKFFLLSAVLALTIPRGHAQECRLSVTGHILDVSKHEKIAGATVLLRPAARKPSSRLSTADPAAGSPVQRPAAAGITVLSDRSGLFHIDHLCPGDYTLLITHAGFDAVETAVRLGGGGGGLGGMTDSVRVSGGGGGADSVADSGLHQTFLLSHSGKQLASAEVIGERRQDIATNAQSEIKTAQLFQTRGETLGESLKGLPGLNSIQTGPSISKPVIHGLHSNRVLILNNGVRQEGQQWGSEHAPEIDPFIASKITIIKGAASVRYGSDAIVGVILVEPKTLAPEKTVQGEVNIVAGSNGQAGATSVTLEGRLKDKLEGFNWRVQGTLKEAGNFRTADYYLKNTGLREQDFSLTSNYKNKKNNFGTEVYYSQFHNKVGIFEGSHVGNVSDLYAAFARSKPITPSYFSYDIDRTYQQIGHELLKVNSYVNLKHAGKIEAQFSYQQNRRDEYDIDYPYSTDPNILKLPQISFQIRTHDLDLIWHQETGHNFSGQVGISGATQGNVFRGVRYLVPNFRNYSGGAFAIERYSKNKWMLEAGARYDYRWLRVYRLNNNNLQPYHNTSVYQNVTGTVGSTYSVNSRLSLSANIGSAWRAPSVNELYIDGIHLSAASYEKGDSSLRAERSYNFTVSGKYQADRFFAEIVLYDNVINDFIYAKPSLTPITLISGTYPLFNYTQADVDLKGVDAELQYKFLDKLSADAKVSIVRAWNKTIHDYLIFMPADRFVNSIRYDIGNWGAWKNWHISMEEVSVLKQTRTPPNSDYVPPPAGYTLINANAGFECPLRKQRLLTIDLAAYNLTNVAYRDYLNRFRYYADDLGINIVLRAKYSF